LLAFFGDSRIYFWVKDSLGEKLLKCCFFKFIYMDFVV